MAILGANQAVYKDLDTRDVAPTPEIPETDPALQIVLKDLNLAEYYLLAKGMSVEWDKDDRLYLFRMPQAFWEGSSVPRSSLGMPLILEHIESLMPQVMNAIFQDDPMFQLEPMPKTTMMAARASQHVLCYQMDMMGFKEEIRVGVKEALTYGTEVWKLSWDQHEETAYKWVRGGPQLVTSSAAGPIAQPTPESKKSRRFKYKEKINMPKLEARHIRHVLVSPELRRPDIRKAAYVIDRSYPNLQQLEDLRGKPGYDRLPPKDMLKALFDPPKEQPERSMLEGRSTTSVLNTGVSSLDINMEFKAMPRWQAPSSDPNLMPLEVLEYWTKEKITVVLNRKLVIKNGPNVFGFLPFLSATYIDVPDSFYGIGVAKLLSGEQRLQQGVINSRLDDLALRLSGTFIRKRGANTPTQQVRLRPGGIIDSDDEKGIQMIEYPPAITDAFEEVAQSDARSQRRTGANEFVTQGSASSTGQVGRTSAGVQTLAAGVGARIGYFVDRVVDSVVIPALEAFHAMNSLWLEEDQISEILDAKMEKFEGDVLDIKNARLKFKMLAGAKMRSRSQRAQNFPALLQFLASSQVQEWLDDNDQKLAVDEAIQQWFDITETPGRQSLIVSLTDDEKKKKQAKAELAQQQTLEAQKHRNSMEELQEKGFNQGGLAIIKELAKHVSPEVAQRMLDRQQSEASDVRDHTRDVARIGLEADQQKWDQANPPPAPAGN